MLSAERRLAQRFRPVAGPRACLVALAFCTSGATFLLFARSPRRPPRSALEGRALAGATSVLRVPHAPASIVLDGDDDDPGWLARPGPARTGPLAAPSGAPSRPYSDARLLWGDGQLYLLLYAADEDIQSGRDAFRLTFARGSVRYAVRVSADGAVENEARDRLGGVDPLWRCGAHVSREVDGTLDDPLDTDEEWSLEMALPLASLGFRGEPGEELGFTVERCDAPGPTAGGCGSWRGRLVLE